MKKVVKPLVIAISIAAAVGVGAVSVAAWSGGSGNTENGVTGGGSAYISFDGFGADATKTLSDKLIPHDQDVGVTAGMVREYIIALPVEGDSIGDYNLKAEYSIDHDRSLSSSAKLVYKLVWGEGAANAIIADKDTDISDWAVYSPSAAVVNNSLTKDTTYYFHIALVSTDTADRNLDFLFKFTLEKKTA